MALPQVNLSAAPDRLGIAGAEVEGLLQGGQGGTVLPAAEQDGIASATRPMINQSPTV